MASLDVRKLPPVVTKGFLGLASLMTALALAVHVASYGPDQIGPFLINVALVLFPVVFLVFGPVFVITAWARLALDRLLSGLPVYVYVVGFAVELYVFVDFFWMIQFLPGQPEQIGSHFYFDDKGTLTPVTAQVYRMGLMHSARLFSGHELIFFGIAALIASRLDAIRSGRLSLEVVLRDEALENSRLPYPLQRMVILQTALPPEACAARLLTPQLPTTFFGRIRGLRGQASPAEFRVELAGPQSQMVYAVGRFETDGGATTVRLLLTFKRWVLMVFAASIFIAPAIWVIVGFGSRLPWFLLALLLVVGVGGNLLFGLDQRRRLLAQIKRASDAQEIDSRKGEPWSGGPRS